VVALFPADDFIAIVGVSYDVNEKRSGKTSVIWVGSFRNSQNQEAPRKAFTQLASFWPTAPGAVAKHMNEIPKVAFSRNGFDPSQITSAKGWSDAKVITGNLAEGIATLKKQPGKDLLAHGGVEFAQSLVHTGLVDEFWLATHPVAVGKGFGLFEKLEKPLYLKLADSKVFSTGAMMNIYRPE
jgi:dihydrofolate reductase